MKTKYQFIYFEQTSDLEWLFRNKKSGQILGRVKYYLPWKQWIAEFNPICIFSQGCLLDIADFLEGLKQ